MTPRGGLVSVNPPSLPPRTCCGAVERASAQSAGLPRVAVDEPVTDARVDRREPFGDPTLGGVADPRVGHELLPALLAERHRQIARGDARPAEPLRRDQQGDPRGAELVGDGAELDGVREGLGAAASGEVQVEVRSIAGQALQQLEAMEVTMHKMA